MHLALALAFLIALPAVAHAEELSAAQIIERASQNQRVKNSIQTLQMTIIDKQGRERKRTITSSIKEGEGGLSKSHIRFIAPADVEGVQFLTIENAKGEDDQWLYMPAGQILNRISGSGKKGSFMGSDFSFEDLSSREADQGSHTKTGTQNITVGGQTFEVYVVETLPSPESKSSYTKLISYVDTKELIPRRIDFFDKKGENHKRLSILEVKKDGELRIPIRTTMENLKKGTRTDLYVESYQVNVPASELPDEMFTPTYLQDEG